MPQMNGGEALVRQLRAEGVDTVFALPGVQIMAAFDALYDARADIRMIHVRHEQATTYMADGYARVSGKPGAFDDPEVAGLIAAGEQVVLEAGKWLRRRSTGH